MPDSDNNTHRRKIEAFLEMGKEGQQNYTKLANMYDKGDWSIAMADALEAFKAE